MRNESVQIAVLPNDFNLMPKTPIARKRKTAPRSKRPQKLLKRRATRLAQSKHMALYQFALTSEDITAVADISRLSRDETGKLLGYQRAEVRKHVSEIADYLDSEAPLFPHPLIIAFSSKVVFRGSRGIGVSDGVSSAGDVFIPVPQNGDAKPGWIVDGQQRALALSRSRRKDFPVPVCAFITDDIELQRDQFLRINNARPLPRGLVTELLPEVSSPLPPRMALRKLPAAICDLLNRDEASPFKGIIHRHSTPKARLSKAVVSDNMVVKMLEESLTNASGCLFPYRNLATGESDHVGIWAVLVTFWSAVRDTFPEAWGLPPTKSRLMHGVGIRAMGKLMDRMMGSIDPRNSDAGKIIRRELAAIAPVCRWTSGSWEGLGAIAWNDLQNVHKHQSSLSNFLIRAYLERRHS
jgi:DGQHR domain-containing protein